MVNKLLKKLKIKIFNIFKNIFKTRKILIFKLTHNYFNYKSATIFYKARVARLAVRPAAAAAAAPPEYILWLFVCGSETKILNKSCRGSL